MYTAGNALKHTPKCTRWHTPSLLDLLSQVRSQEAADYTPSMSSSTLPGMLPRMLPIALGGTLPTCSTVRSQLLSMAHSQPA